MSRKLPPKKLKKLALVVVVMVCSAVLVGNLLGRAYGAQFKSRSLQLSNGTIGLTSNYDFSFDFASVSTLGSIYIQFCSNDPIIGDVCSVPAGFNDLSAAITTDTNLANFAISGSSTANSLLLSRTPAPDSTGQSSITFSNITNPSSPGAYYARILAYSSTNGSGSYSDYGGIAFAVNSALNISATVPPYLLFCTGITISGDNCANATGDYINLGILSPNISSQATSQMLTATNAASGYAITVYGTTLESGTNVINNIASSDVSRPGTPQFGLNLRQNTSPTIGQDPSGNGSGTPNPGYDTSNFFQYNSGDIVASYTKPDLDRLYTASYLVNVPATQAPGVYVTTLTYICVATF